MRAHLPHALLFAAAIGMHLLPSPAAADEPPMWRMHTIDPKTDTERGADGVRLLDVNGDGLLDIATGWEEARLTRVYLHPGAAKVGEAWPKVTVGRGFSAPEDAVLCDLDGDGAYDVVSSCEGSKMFVHWAPSDPADYMTESAWKTEPFPAGTKVGGMFVVPLRIDGQHGLDLISGGKGKDLVWFQAPENARDLSAWKAHTISSQCSDGWTMGIYAADMDGDGFDDVVWTARKGNNGGVRWLRNPGPGASQQKPWTAHDLHTANADYMFGDVGDVDGDGRLDVVAPVSNGAVHFFRNAGENRWQDVAIAATNGTSRNKGAAIGDVNLDGRPDVVVTHVGSEGPVWYEQRTDPTDPADWLSHPTGAGGGKSDLTALYDVDRDGDLDVLTTVETKAYQVVWYENPYSQAERGSVPPQRRKGDME